MGLSVLRDAVDSFLGLQLVATHPFRVQLNQSPCFGHGVTHTDEFGGANQILWRDLPGVFAHGDRVFLKEPDNVLGSRLFDCAMKERHIGLAHDAKILHIISEAPREGPRGGGGFGRVLPPG